MGFFQVLTLPAPGLELRHQNYQELHSDKPCGHLSFHSTFDYLVLSAAIDIIFSPLDQRFSTRGDFYTPFVSWECLETCFVVLMETYYWHLVGREQEALTTKNYQAQHVNMKCQGAEVIFYL